MGEEEKVKKRKDLEPVNGEKTAEDALLETCSENYHVVLFIHGEKEREIDREIERSERKRRFFFRWLRRESLREREGKETKICAEKRGNCGKEGIGSFWPPEYPFFNFYWLPLWEMSGFEWGLWWVGPTMDDCALLICPQLSACGPPLKSKDDFLLCSVVHLDRWVHEGRTQ